MHVAHPSPGVPSDPVELLSYIEEMREAQRRQPLKGPLVVHCRCVCVCVCVCVCMCVALWFDKSTNTYTHTHTHTHTHARARARVVAHMSHAALVLAERALSSSSTPSWISSSKRVRVRVCARVQCCCPSHACFRPGGSVTRVVRTLHRCSHARAGLQSEIDIQGAVARVREQRSGMIQTEVCGHSPCFTASSHKVSADIACLPGPAHSASRRSIAFCTTPWRTTSTS
jgi:hypothetical protein